MFKKPKVTLSARLKVSIESDRQLNSEWLYIKIYKNEININMGSKFLHKD